LASIRKEKSYKNLRFQAKTQQDPEKIKDSRSALQDAGEVSSLIAI